MDFSAARSDLNFTFTLRYVNNGDGTVTDNKTGLMWQKGDDGTGETGLMPVNIVQTWYWAAMTTGACHRSMN